MRLIFGMATALLLSACGTQETAPPVSAAVQTGQMLEGSSWVAEELGGTGVIPDSEVTVKFMSDGRVAGKASCNTYFGGYTEKGNLLTFGQMGATKMACPGPSMEQEYRFLQLLIKVNSFELRPEGVLLLKTADGDSLRFKAEPQ